MTHREDCRQIRQSLGVYVLGAIEPAERAQVDAHLAGCPDCREELADLAGLPALLHRVPVAEARLLADDGQRLQAPPPDELLHSLLDRVAGVRRARRWRTLVAAAAVAVLALGAGAGGAAALSGGSPPAPVAQGSGETISGTSASSGVHLTVRYRGVAWGTTMEAQVTGIAPGTVCQLRVTSRSGHSSIVGSWQVSYGDQGAWYPVSTALDASQIRSFQLTSNGKTLVSMPDQ
ncbi:MAG: anti-sigma factor family protein [Gemmatimonadota bacterium]